MIKKLTKRFLHIVLPIFLFIPVISNAQTINEPITVPSFIPLIYNNGNAVTQFNGHATTTGLILSGRSGRATNFLGFYVPRIIPANSTTTISYTQTGYADVGGSGAQCNLSLGLAWGDIRTYRTNPWTGVTAGPFFSTPVTTSLNATGTITYSHPSSSNGAVVFFASNQNTSVYCDYLITDWKINGEPAYQLLTFPVTLGGASSMGTTTVQIATSTFTDTLLFLFGLLVSFIIIMVLIKIIWKR